MRTDNLTYGYQCVMCGEIMPSHRSQGFAIRKAGLHAQENPGHAVLIFRNNQTALDIYWCAEDSTLDI